MKTFDEALGLFWGAAMFIGALVSIIIGFRGKLLGWIKAFLIGGCIFLITGLIFQGILTLLKKEKDSAKIHNRNPNVCGVVYDVTSKPPKKIEFE